MSQLWGRHQARHDSWCASGRCADHSDANARGSDLRPRVVLPGSNPDWAHVGASSTDRCLSTAAQFVGKPCGDRRSPTGDLARNRCTAPTSRQSPRRAYPSAGKPSASTTWWRRTPPNSTKCVDALSGRRVNRRNSAGLSGLAEQLAIAIPVVTDSRRRLRRGGDGLASLHHD
jgi:hypothetical protein